MSTKPFLIDTNILIEAKNRYYRFVICPGFWDALIHHNSDSTIVSIDKVKIEINDPKYDDDLRDWVNSSISDDFFKSTVDEEVQKYYEEIINWVQANTQFKTSARAKFVQGKCDPYLIAYAKAKDCYLVTNEAFHPNIEKKVPIPNVCHQFGVINKTLYEMLEVLGVQFVLKE